MSDQCYRLTRTGFKGDVTQDEVLFVGKRNVVKDHISFVTRHRSVGNRFARFIHQRKYTSGGDHRAVEVRELVHHPGNRLEHTAQYIDKSVQHPERYKRRAVQAAESEVPQHQHKREVTQRVHQIMRGKGVQVQHFILVLHIIVVQMLELFAALLLAAENPDDRHPLNRFIDNGVDLAQPRADDRIVFGGDFAVQHNPDNNDRHDEQADEAKPHIE
ncbi:hypothetical protein D3C73_1092170 [compost metagenome]